MPVNKDRREATLLRRREEYAELVKKYYHQDESNLDDQILHQVQT